MPPRTDAGNVEQPETVATPKWWGPQTDLAIANFPISGEVFPLTVIHEIARIKGVAARINLALGVLPLDAAATDAIVAAAREVTAGRWDDQFPIDVFQTGSGTSSNMNVNEVIARLATQRLESGERAEVSSGATTEPMRLSTPIHPNDHVNASQSSNDVIPTAVHLAVARAIRSGLVPAAEELRVALKAKADEWSDVVKAGRTHLMDAVPMTLGQEFGGYARAVQLGLERIRGALSRLYELPLGGTAVGTGLNAPVGFARLVIECLAEDAGAPFSEAVDHFEAQGGRDALVEVSAACRGLAISLNKLANDLRWMGSGPAAGLAEIALPSLQPGSSIMPGKVNPVIPEVVCQVVAQVIGNDAAVAFAGASGSFELNVMIPVIARNVLSSVALLTSSCAVLARRCISGLVADEPRLRAMASSSPAVITALATSIGYDTAASLVKESAATHRSIVDLVVERRLLSRAEADAALDVDRMAQPHRATGVD